MDGQDGHDGEVGEGRLTAEMPLAEADARVLALCIDWRGEDVGVARPIGGRNAEIDICADGA